MLFKHRRPLCKVVEDTISDSNDASDNQPYSIAKSSTCQEDKL